MSNIERKLATIRKVSEIVSIEGADAIELVKVDGWRSVVKKGEYKVGDLVVYCEIDSWIPHELAPFLTKGSEPREYNGVKGERLRSVKLRGTLSQGLILPLERKMEEWILSNGKIVKEGDDVTQELGIQKWEAPAPAQLAGKIEGLFPTDLVPKTDQERIQNCIKDVRDRIRKLLDYNLISEPVEFVKEEKLDGSSCTIICHEGEFKVCSRNLELRRDENNSFWKVASRYEKVLMDYHTKHKNNFAIQGELIGEGIQGNPYKIKGQELFVFDIYSIDVGSYLVRHVRELFVERFGMNNVPVIGYSYNTYNDYGDDAVDRILCMADGNSLINPKVKREGIVYKCATDGSFTFKAISNSWLIKKGE